MSKKTSSTPDERLQYVIENAADVQRRMVYLFGEVTDESAHKCVVALQHMDKDDGPISLVLNSVGGLISGGLAIYDAIRFCHNRIIVIGTGDICSMGSVILQAGDWRQVTRHAHLMVHDAGQDPGFLDTHHMKVTAEMLIKDNNIVRDILCDRTGRDADTMKRWMRDETWFVGDEIVKNGFADEIVQNNKDKE